MPAEKPRRSKKKAAPKRRRRRPPAAAKAAPGELLVELRAELPPRLVGRLARRLASRLFEELMSRGLGPRALRTGATRRRLMVCCSGLPAREPDREETVLGPPAADAWDDDGAPTAALIGFAERLAVEPAAVSSMQTEKGRYAGIARHRVGQPLAAVLAALLPRLLAELPRGRTMVWGEGRGPWVRPLQGIVALLDGQVLDFSFAGVAAGNTTAGHPILSPKPFAVRDHADYRRQLGRRGIVVGLAERRQVFLERLSARLDALQARLPRSGDGPEADDGGVVTRMALSCEIPGLVEGDFDQAFLALPEEILLAVLGAHPGAIVPRGADGKLMPRFLTVADRADDPSGRVKAGYQRVVAGRLTDARFLRQADRRQPLAERARELERLAMPAGLGSWAAQATRVQGLAEAVLNEIGDQRAVPHAREAAALLKADLGTRLVSELGALQGVIGGLYAREEGYVEPVWQALYDQRLPRGIDDPLPRGPVGRAVAVADRLDRVVGLVAAAGVPAANKDRHGLRPLTQGLVRLLLEGELDVDLDLLVARAALGYGEALPRSADDTVAEVRAFLLDRVRHLLGRRGFAFDEIEAATAIRANRLPDLVARVAALNAVRAEGDFHAVVRAAKRIVNMVAGADEHSLRDELLVEDAERGLADTLKTVRAAVDDAVALGRYPEGLRAMGELVPALDRFFADVLVMDEDRERRHNRLALLQATRRVFWRIARLREMTVEPAAPAEEA